MSCARPASTSPRRRRSWWRVESPRRGGWVRLTRCGRTAGSYCTCPCRSTWNNAEHQAAHGFVVTPCNRKHCKSASILLGSQHYRCPLLSSGAGGRYRTMSAAGARAVANQLHVAAVIDRWNRQTNGLPTVIHAESCVHRHSVRPTSIAAV